MIENLDLLQPLVYTPVVGYVCQNFSHLFPNAKNDGRGLFININEKDRIPQILKSWPSNKIRAIVVTDGER